MVCLSIRSNGRFVSAGACLSLKPAAAERPQVQGSQRGKKFEDEWGALDQKRRDGTKL